MNEHGLGIAAMVLGAYLVGAIPFGLLIGFCRGVDIRQHGSGNIGATNLGRIVGRPWGYVGFVLDVAKGLVPTLLGGAYLKSLVEDGATLSQGGMFVWLLMGAACILGHMFPVYLRFRGGKGVATSLGVVLGVWPYFTLAAPFALLVWIGMWGWTRYVSLASIVAGIAFPLGFAMMIFRIEAWRYGQLWPLLAFAMVMAALIIFRHRHNIRRLMDGTENRGGKATQQ